MVAPFPVRLCARTCVTQTGDELHLRDVVRKDDRWLQIWNCTKMQQVTQLTSCTDAAIEMMKGLAAAFADGPIDKVQLEASQQMEAKHEEACCQYRKKKKNGLMRASFRSDFSFPRQLISKRISPLLSSQNDYCNIIHNVQKRLKELYFQMYIQDHEFVPNTFRQLFKRRKRARGAAQKSAVPDFGFQGLA